MGDHGADGAGRDEADGQAIVDLAVAYVRAVDAGDFAALGDVFTPDATAELGGQGQDGIDEIRDRLEHALGRFARWEHRLGTHRVDLDGDVATASHTVRATHVRPPGESPPTYTVRGTYEDRLVRTPGGWRIAHRRLVVQDRD